MVNKNKKIRGGNGGLDKIDFSRFLGIMNKARLPTRITQRNNQGSAFSGRDLYEILGYPPDITYKDCLSRYLRQDVARRVIDGPVEGTWQEYPYIYESEAKVTSFEKSLNSFLDRFDLYGILSRLDRLASLGRYSVLYIGVPSSTNDLTKPIEKAKELLYLTPFSEDEAQINSWDLDVQSQRYGLPLTYQLSPTNVSSAYSTGATVARTVHWSRVLHVVETTITNEVYGSPRLEPVYNRLLDLEEIVGGSAEMFWRGAFPGYTATQQDNVHITDEQMEVFREELSAYVNDLKRWLYSDGFKIEAMSPQVTSPVEHVKVQMNMISAATGIPIRILIGSERGELASSQDERAWLSRLERRREHFASKSILRPLLDRLIDIGVLDKPQKGYFIDWPPLLSLSEEEAAKIGKIRTETLATYVNTPGADLLEPPALFLSREMGMTRGEIEIVLNASKKNRLEDEETGNL